MEWYYAKHGERKGPVTIATLRSMMVTGEVAQTDLVWREGMSDWLPAGQVPEISGSDTVADGSLSPAPPNAGEAPVGASGTGVSPGPTAAARIPNYLVQSILVTIFCCWPLGIPAIVFAAKVDGLVAQGDIAGAMDASRKAKTWSWVSFGAGLTVVLIYLGMVLLGLSLGVSTVQPG